MASRILFLAPIVEDAAVKRRASMFVAGGATATVLGFRRSSKAVATLEGCDVVDLGRSFNAKFFQRTILVLKSIYGLDRFKDLFASSDIIYARNLEMLAIASYGRRFFAPNAKLVYEVLDIHRLLLDRGIVGKSLRWLEGRLTGRASLVVTSSPAFIKNYFEKISLVRVPIHLIENKVAGWDQDITPIGGLNPGPPWIIGWFGIIRCRKSLIALKNLVEKSNGNVQVIIRGKPAEDQFPDFASLIADVPGIHFAGPYKNPEDLSSIYRTIHFIWAIDHFEEGQNSSWLLPNRLYEGGAYKVVPIAENDVETGHFLHQRNIGIIVNSILSSELGSIFNDLTPDRFEVLRTAIVDVPRNVWIADVASCRHFVEMLLQR